MGCRCGKCAASQSYGLLHTFPWSSICSHLLAVVLKYRYNENTPSAGTERIDRIGKCHSGLWDVITSSSKTAVLVIFASQRDT